MKVITEFGMTSWPCLLNVSGAATNTPCKWMDGVTSFKNASLKPGET